MSYELERIKQLCQERNWSIYRLASEMDTSPADLYNMFRRTTTPSITTLRRICKALGISMAYFYSTDGDIYNLGDQHKRVLHLYDALNEEDKAKAEAYMLGLMDE